MSVTLVHAHLASLTNIYRYVPEIVEFVNKIVERGYAYVHEGSVYFDTRAFDSAQGRTSSGEDAEWRHIYAKLEPWSKGNRALMEEGEGPPSIVHHACLATHIYSFQVPCHNLPRDTLQTLRCGKHLNLENLPGLQSGGQVGQAGISNALLWRQKSWARIWTSILVGMISLSRTTTTK